MVVEYLRGSAGHGVEARLAGRPEELLGGDVEPGRGVEHLCCTVGMEVDLGRDRFDALDQLQVFGGVFGRRNRTLQADLCRAEFPGLRDEVFQAHTATVGQNGCRLEVAVGDKGEVITGGLAAGGIGQRTQFVQVRTVGLQEITPLQVIDRTGIASQPSQDRLHHGRRHVVVGGP